MFDWGKRTWNSDESIMHVRLVCVRASQVVLQDGGWWSFEAYATDTGTLGDKSLAEGDKAPLGGPHTNGTLQASFKWTTLLFDGA